ncbi:hypothetical protein [Merdimmobilis hominis]|uniref:hypothetical protein n=1 Tax=Merdimmobilis hominis TaxID=2897707 RepID=UPI0008F8F468|nr:hypothetical protein [Merdimmobilis hominis]
MYHQPFRHVWRPGPATSYCVEKGFSTTFGEQCDGYARAENGLRTLLGGPWPQPFPGRKRYNLLKAITFEVEENLLQILEDSGLPKPTKVDRSQLKRLEPAYRLTGYRAVYTMTGEEFCPFAGLLDGELPWFLEGAKVFASNSAHRERATQENLILAVAGLRCLLYAQYGPEVDLAIAPRDKEKQGMGYFKAQSLFQVIPPEWEEAEQYAFDPRGELTFENYPF